MASPVSFLTDKKLVKFGGTTAGATTITFTTIDMTSGGLFDKVTMIILLGTVVDAGTLRLRAYTCDDSGGTNPDLMDDITGAEGQTATITTSTSSNKMMVLTVYKPKTPYVQFTLERAAQNSTVLDALAILEDPRQLPVAVPSTILAQATGLCN